MGKRKSSKPPPKKKMQKLATIFNCPFCQEKETVEIKLDKVHSKGKLVCTACAVDYECTIGYLTSPIDVYSEWIDECAQVNKEDKPEKADKP